MMIINAIKKRRSIKQFKSDPVSEDDVMSWLEAASYAPNHRLNEPWELLFVGVETRAKLNHKTNFGGAPVVLTVLSKPANSSFERDENVMAAACFVQNFLLAAHEAGAGVYWASLGALPHNRSILGVQDGYDVIGILGVGYPEDVPMAKQRTAIASKITYLA
ncbi:nitroreductase family protein [Paenibacillus radicis (ex Gao et al. 2016)]|uniref:NAD(P)H nitroreductase YfhC n=1 Tax=Paenibacillus radicis (ex Gao et al. 2016) TaxID=1737354 RepID=A0A917H676_9BACL|nr:nitroreductase [Paenibacillus radicis (ex Gao et al. 2016)]GGG68503.1 putative NAD(P)H nitroreductase YfhC [Paenibacillus radicis (ex Gao et al. 2016)]